MKVGCELLIGSGVPTTRLFDKSTNGCPLLISLLIAPLVETCHLGRFFRTVPQPEIHHVCTKRTSRNTARYTICLRTLALCYYASRDQGGPVTLAGAVNVTGAPPGMACIVVVCAVMARCLLFIRGVRRVSYTIRVAGPDESG